VSGSVGHGSSLEAGRDNSVTHWLERPGTPPERIGVRGVTQQGDELSEVSPSLAWVRDVVWGREAGTRIELNPVEGRPLARHWWVLPSTSSPTLLVPTTGRVGARSLSQFNDSMTQRMRLKKAGVGLLIRGRLAPLFSRDRFSVATPASDRGRDLIESELPRLLGVPRVDVAISIGRSLRPNIKPVLQIMASDGRVLAFAKLAWNPLTSELVENEVTTLTRLEGMAIRSFRAPRVLHHGEWNGFPLVLLSPLSHGLLRRSPVDAMPSSVVLREVASLGTETRGPLIGGPYWQEVSRRALEVARQLEDGGRMEAAISGLADRVSTQEVIHCMSHGDFAPWNMLHTADSINVWDWERASETRPLGVDALHFTFEVAYHKQGRDPVAAIDIAFERSRGVLREVGVPRRAGEAIRDVYVLERLTRLLEGRRAGVPVDDRLLEGLSGFLDAGTPRSDPGGVR
jgi:hypothetical protein